MRGLLLCEASAIVFLVAGLAFLPSGPAAADELRLAAPAGDGMVLQRNTPVPLRGWAKPGVRVAVAFAGTSLAARAGAGGAWSGTLPAQPAGGPFDLTVVAGGERLHVADVLVGDVWLCSGQSNMEWVVADAADAAAEIAAANDPRIRHLKMPRAWAPRPLAAQPGLAWRPALPEHVGGFTAVGYYFARSLRPHLDVPIGLLDASWGGSRIEPWMSARALALDAVAMQRILAGEETWAHQTLERLRARVGALPERDGGLVDGKPLWADPDLDDASWDRIEVPARWEEVGFEGMDGVGWYRTTFELTADEARSGVRIGLGTIDDSDVAWVNGQEVGHTTLAWNRPRVYAVPPAGLREGRNVLAVRVEDTGGGGGIWGKQEQLFVEGTHRRPLAGAWRFRLGVVTVNLDYHKTEVPTVIFNAMIHPLQSYPVAGVLWYQGESNAGGADAFAYRRLFPGLIADWRAGWGRGDLPFLWVQLASFMPAASQPTESSWAVLRESQAAALALPRTAQAVAIDIGDADDVHPANKQEVGRRLALAARKVAYGEDIVHSGPSYRRHEVRDGRVEIAFDHVGSGLVARGDAAGRIVGFAVAGADRRFVWAEAVVAGETVAVWSDRVREPVAVRYSWADNPAGANLFNREGLPAGPFRTDDW
ncbi:MAG: beta galactosidase jelly roll domain-containing protein [Acidobacteria bacterium]|nr:beta galactosidase jelly roll domain-containing protein [Acidobacteriota bacterium]